MRNAISYLLLLTATLFISCQEEKKTEIDHKLEEAENLITNYPDSALIVLQNTSKLSKKNDKTYATWCILKAWAQYKTYNDSIPESELMFACNYFLSRDEHGRRALAYFLRSQIHFIKGIGSEAEWVEDLMKGCKEVDLTQLHALASSLYFNYAQAFLKRELPHKAIPLYNKALENAKKEGLVKNEVMIYLNFAKTYQLIGDKEKSIFYAKKAVEIAKGNNILTIYGKALDILSDIYIGNNDYDIALKYVRESKDLNEKLLREGIRKEPVRYLTIAQAHLGLNNIDSAVLYFNKSINNGSIFARADSYKGLYIINRDYRKDLEKAIYYGDKYYALNDSIKDGLQNDKIAKIDEKYAIEQAQKENYILKIQRRNILLISVFVISILLIFTLIIILVYHQKLKNREIKLSKILITINRNKEQINKNEEYINELKSIVVDGENMQKVIEEQKQELCTLQLKTDKLRVENVTLSKSIDSYKNVASLDRICDINHLLDKMVILEDREKELSIELLNKNELLSRLRQEPKFLAEQEWTKIQEITNKIYNSFCVRLTNDFPQLTQVDIQMCMLIKLRFSIPQMAIMNAVSPTSVSKHKLRLKKRMLQSDESIFNDGKSLDLFIWEF